jgi:hypothetical protein
MAPHRWLGINFTIDQRNNCQKANCLVSLVGLGLMIAGLVVWGREPRWSVNAPWAWKTMTGIGTALAVLNCGSCCCLERHSQTAAASVRHQQALMLRLAQVADPQDNEALRRLGGGAPMTWDRYYSGWRLEAYEQLAERRWGNDPNRCRAELTVAHPLYSRDPTIVGRQHAQRLARLYFSTHADPLQARQALLRDVLAVGGNFSPNEIGSRIWQCLIEYHCRRAPDECLLNEPAVWGAFSAQLGDQLSAAGIPEERHASYQQDLFRLTRNAVTRSWAYGTPEIDQRLAPQMIQWIELSPDQWLEMASYNHVHRNLNDRDMLMGHNVHTAVLYNPDVSLRRILENAEALLRAAPTEELRTALVGHLMVRIKEMLEREQRQRDHHPLPVSYLNHIPRSLLELLQECGASETDLAPMLLLVPKATPTAPPPPLTK